MTHRLNDRVALVFGAGSIGSGMSIGRATAVALGRAGAKVFAVDINRDSAEETAIIIRGEGGECEVAAADVTISAEVKNAVSRCMARFGKIDILQNNVGVVHLGGPVEMSEETWLQSMKLNVGSAFLTCKHVIPIMEACRSGVITNISSIAAVRWVGIKMIGYSAFKAALNQFTQTVALQYAPVGIRSNAIIVGRMDTPTLRAALGPLYPDEDSLIAEKSATCPTGHLGNPWDVASASVFLASDDAKYITGTLLPVDGGVLGQSFPDRPN